MNQMKRMKRLVKTRTGPGRRTLVKRRKQVTDLQNLTPLTPLTPAPRFFNPFSWFNQINFPPSECTSSTGLVGTCYTSSDCLKKGGKSDGSCASGNGVCCTLDTNDCSSETSANGTYFINPGTILSVCTILIRPMDETICQVRLEFENLELAQPDENGICRMDYLQVTGGVDGRKIPSVCGTNSGQHIVYGAIPNFPARMSVVVDTQTALAAGFTRSWKIKIIQHSCNSPSLSPAGCLQYFTGISGNVTSFNWKLGTEKMNHLANQDYTVCVRRESGYCSIEWSTPMPVIEQHGVFSLSGPKTSANTPLAASDTEMGDTKCKEDYVAIPQGWGGTSSSAIPGTSRSRFCGQALGFCSNDGCSSKELGPVTSGVTPFIIGVVTDAMEATAEESRGFQLKFRQQPCS